MCVPHLINKVHVFKLKKKHDMCILVCHKGGSQNIELKDIMLMMWQWHFDHMAKFLHGTQL